MIGRLQVAVVLLTAASLVVSPAYAAAQEGQEQNQAQSQGQAGSRTQPPSQPERKPERQRRSRRAICAVSKGPTIRSPRRHCQIYLRRILRRIFQSRC